jgi:hypothetical protein
MATSRLNRTFNAPFVSASATTVADRGDADAMPAFWAMSLTRVAFSYGRTRTLRLQNGSKIKMLVWMRLHSS